MRREGAVAGVLLNYLPTAANYVLAIVYIVVLTRYIPLTQYGYYNALFAIVNTIGAVIPIPGINSAIAREGAIEFARGRDARPYFAASVFMSLVMSVIYAVALVAAVPIYLGNGIPPWLLGTVYVYIGAVIAQSLAGALGLYLWLVGRVATQGAGATIGMLVLRGFEVALIVIMRNVYAIAISTLLGSLAQLLYYLVNVGFIPNPIRGLGTVLSGIKGFLELGLQSWVLGYVGTLITSVMTYLVYRYLGPGSTAIYGLALAMIGSVTAMGPAVSTVLSSRVSHGIGVGVNVGRVFRDFAIPSFIASALMAQLVVLALPILPRLGIVNGDYIQSIPYASALFGSAPLFVAVTVYSSYYWVVGRGWYAVMNNLVGLGVGIATYVALHGLGLYMAVVSIYIINVITLIAYWTLERWSLRSKAVLAVGLALALTLASSWSLPIGDAPITWPTVQLIMIIATTAIAYMTKPLPTTILNQIPKPLKPLLKPFTTPSQ
ncbi:MAG: oligosaccharide flippase family protein [Vulcanisaeta sp.]|jgi:O-antigen/teichoic acid export membrane protein|nr:oligosaccharide flippase family protein [Vulcanisaeta sp.]MCG2867429.1 oligosaccharide flippase family protein [Vulcanisaeta sp.]